MSWSINFVPARFDVRVQVMKTQIRDHFVRCLTKAEDKLAELLRDQMPARIPGQGPGDPSWIPDLQASVRTLYRDIADHYIDIGVGLPFKEGTYQQVRAMVVNAGSGSAAGNPPIWTKPGQQVWNEDLSGKKTSSAKTAYPLPAGFNQQGNRFVENAMKAMAKHFEDVLEEAAQSLPDAVFYQNIVSTPGVRR